MASISQEQKTDSRQIVDRQIQRTRRALKIVDLLSGSITMVIGVLLFLLAAALLEHWLVPGGWGLAARGVLFATLLAGVLWYGWRAFWPLARQSINPVFAAQTIEQSSPSLKNSLLNLLLFRSCGQQLTPTVYQAIEQQAANRLSQVHVDTAVDHSALLRLGYTLVAVVAVCALYSVLSPKSAFVSANRVLLPWSDIRAPSRVQIVNVEPGETSVARGERLAISAEVFGLGDDEPVMLCYSTSDEQIARQQIAMQALTPVSEGGTQFECQLPAKSRGSAGPTVQGTSGVQQDLQYWIEAGDARSARYAVRVFARPTMVVQRVRYDYPTYTGYPSREVETTGDLRGLEGTRVTIFGLSNQPIGKAHVDFEADGRRDLTMRVDDQRATVSFPLELRPDRRSPRFSSYVLRMTTTAGRSNRQPPKYRIDVTPDYAPEIGLTEPQEEVVDARLDETVRVGVEARDPDFALSEVLLLGEVQGQNRLQRQLLSQNHTGKFTGSARLTPRDLGLQVGDTLEYWAEARDNRTPEANTATTRRQTLRVTDAAEKDRSRNNATPQEDDPDRQPPDDSGSDQSSDSKQGEQGQDSSQGGEKSAGSDDNMAEGDQGGSDGKSDQEESDQSAGDEDQSSGSGGGPSESDEDSGQSSTENSADSQSGADSSDDSTQGDSSGGGDSGSADQQSGGPSGDKPSGGGGEKVSPEGDDDGNAFERMADHFAEQDANRQDQQGDENGAGSNSRTENQNDTDERQRDSNWQDDQTGQENHSQPQDRTSSDDASSDRTSTAGTDQAEGENADGQQPAEGEQQPQGPDGKVSPEQGPAGAGDSGGQQQGMPEPQERQPAEKRPAGKQSQETGEGEPASQGGERRESDSHGGQEGDRTGGGQEGAGQQADAEGTGGAGEHQAADEGAGQAAQQGEGNTSTRPGGDEPSDGQTGQSSETQSGTGSKQDSQQGEQPGKPGEQAGGKQTGSQQSPPPQADGDQSGQSGQGGSPDSPLGGGQSGSDASSPPTADQAEPGGDQANLDYARKQTDLVLDRLSDQLDKKKVDSQLLDKLGWNKDELQRFVARWKNLKSKAAGSGDEQAAAQQELNAALRSLGLRKDRRLGYRSSQIKDDLRNLRDANRTRTPAEYVEQMRRYVKGVTQGEAGEANEPD